MQYLGEAGNLRHRLDAGQHMLAQRDNGDRVVSYSGNNGRTASGRHGWRYADAKVSLRQDLPTPASPRRQPAAALALAGLP